MRDNTITVLCIGDVVGLPGRMMFQKYSGHLKERYNNPVIIVNGENSSSQGRGITPRIMRFFKHNGADVVTSGNHIWQKRDIYSYFTEHTDLIRPANFYSKAPGSGVALCTKNGISVGVINLQGRVFMKELVDCPFRTAESILTFLKHKTSVIIVDMHAETTSEKMAMGHFLDGKVSAVVGTHTHTQTADERVLPGGTAFMTDLGMGGALNGMLGMKKEAIIENFITQMPTKFVVDTTPPFCLQGAAITIDTDSGRARAIERFNIIDHELTVGEETEE